MDLVSLETARNLGLLRYFTGKPCSNGHVTERQVSSRGCLGCQRDKNARNKEYHAAASKRWALANPERYKKNSSEWSKANKARKWQVEQRRRDALGVAHKEKQSAWWKANPDRAIAYASRCRAKREKAVGEFGPEHVQALMKAQRGMCAECATSISHRLFHVDHVMPICRGGTNYPDNLQLLCAPCNLSKGRLTMDEWRQRKEARNSRKAVI